MNFLRSNLNAKSDLKDSLDDKFNERENEFRMFTGDSRYDVNEFLYS